MQTTSVRIDRHTHEQLKELAARLDITVGSAVALSVRSLAQRQMGAELASQPLRDDEVAWLDADLG